MALPSTWKMPLDSLAFTGWVGGQMLPSGATHGGRLVFGSGSADATARSAGAIARSAGATAGSTGGTGGHGSGDPSGGAAGDRRSMVGGADRVRRSFATTKTQPTSSPSHNAPRNVRRITAGTLTRSRRTRLDETIPVLSWWSSHDPAHGPPSYVTASAP